MAGTESSLSSQAASAAPTWMRQALTQAGIDVRASASSLRQQVEALGLEVLEMGEDSSGAPRERPRYFAAVAAGRGSQAVVGLHWSSRGYTEALAWAVAKVLRTRREDGAG